MCVIYERPFYLVGGKFGRADLIDSYLHMVFRSLMGSGSDVVAES